jgi:surface polysaccharide O-acyltransferase-like enzyme
MIDPESSLRLKLLRFPPIVGVIYIHAYGTTIPYANGTLGRADTNGLTDFIRTLISQGLARIAVPLFFLMAGYLFFANFRWSEQTFKKKVLGRTRSLLIPFLIWNSIVLAIVALAQAIPATQPYFSGAGSLIADYSLFQYVNALLGLKGYPIAYHFWFIRDLILLVLLAPVIAVILRFAFLPFFLALYIFWVADLWPIMAPGVVGLFFFSIGAFCAIKGKSLFVLDRFGALALLAFIPILLVDTLWHDAWYNVFFHRTGLMVGVVAALYSTRLLAKHTGVTNALVRLGGASFFVYAAHEPFLRIMRMLSYRFLPLDGPYMILLIYLLLPLLIIAVLLGCHRGLSSLCPRLLSVITGGR